MVVKWMRPVCSPSGSSSCFLGPSGSWWCMCDSRKSCSGVTHGRECSQIQESKGLMLQRRRRVEVGRGWEVIHQWSCGMDTSSRACLSSRRQHGLCASTLAGWEDLTLSVVTTGRATAQTATRKLWEAQRHPPLGDGDRATGVCTVQTHHCAHK